MPLSCSCDWEIEPGQEFFEEASDFKKYNKWIGKRCSSCGELIRFDDFCISFGIFKSPDHEIEVNIYGEDGGIPMADRYFCELCGEIFWNLFDVGFSCIGPGDDMRELLKDYQAEYAPPKLENPEL